MRPARRTECSGAVDRGGRRLLVLAFGLSVALATPRPAHGQPARAEEPTAPSSTPDAADQAETEAALPAQVSTDGVATPGAIPAPLDPTPPAPEVASAAERLFEEGLAALQREDYATALVAFERARTIEERPILLFNIAMCRRALLHYPEAIAIFRQYLLVAGPDTPEARRQQVRDLVAEMERNLARVAVRVDQDGATVLVDGERVGLTPLAELVQLGPGSHVVEVRREGFRDAWQSFDIMAGESKELALVLQPLAASAVPGPAVPEDEGGGIVESWWFWTLIGAVVVGGAVTTAVLLWPEDETPAVWHVEGP